ncbi:MAG: uracil-DNA glycosylase [Candidatus Omnitrophota bacterium]
MTAPLDLFDPGKNSILDAPDYPSFRERLRNSACDRCALARGRTTIVVDRGNFNSKVVLIGEAPGENEDHEGKAFVGRAGKLLDRLLLELGFDTNRDALIMNVVKCRPPENRAPKPDEAAACSDFFRKQLSLLDARIVILMGATALRHTLKHKKDFSMKEEVGKFFEDDAFPDAKVMVIFHPAYILRDPRKEPLMRAHLARLVTLWKTL